MEKGTIDLADELAKLSAPLVEYLAKHFDPMCTITISTDTVRLMKNGISIPTAKNNYLQS